jgi:hypothetical protein
MSGLARPSRKHPIEWSTLWSSILTGAAFDFEFFARHAYSVRAAETPLRLLN